MCGIAGFQGNFSTELLAEMSAVQSHRGPDGSGLFFDQPNGVGLSHQRLAIIDLAETGSQPMEDCSGRFTIVFNGEIYNFKELKAQLDKSGCTFRGHSDTEVLVNLWAIEGPPCLKKLNGIFAFALWDKKEETLHVARDGMGTKPLYFSSSDSGFRFASEIKALLKDRSISRELDVRAIRDHLTYIYCPWPRTILKAVQKLAPGERLEIKNGKIVGSEKFYEIPIESTVQKWDMETAAGKVREGLRTAVHRQMVSDVPVGCFLSGGLDSSAVVAFAKEVAPNGQLPCYTIDVDFEKAGFSEDLPYAKKVAMHLGVDLNVIQVKPSMVDELDRMLWHLDEPLGDPAIINLMLICAAARQEGIKVLLGGAGGDDLFTGYRRHYSRQLERWWSWLPSPARSLLRTGSSRLGKNRPTLRRIAKAFSYADSSSDERLLGYFRWVTEQQVNAALSDKSLGELSDDRFCQSLGETLDGCPETGAGKFDLNRMLYLEMSHFLVDHNLTYTDKLSMAYGVEARVPFLDPDLVALSYQIPAKLKQSGKTGKAVFKHAMRGILPDDVIYRPKTGFGAPLRSWLKNELKPLVQELLSKEVVAARGIFDPEMTQKLVQDDQSGKIDVSYMLFSMMCIERWCQLFLDE